MRTSEFFDRVPELFDGAPADSDPIDPYWAQLCTEVTGFTSPNELAVLALAASMLEPGECYLEVGTFRGRSLCAAARNCGDTTMYAVENFLEFGMAGLEARTDLEKNIATYCADADVRLVEGDCFRLLANPAGISEPVGVYFYDGEHTVLAHYLALAVAEPVLADETLVLIDDATWPVVQRAHRLFLKKHPGWKIVERWDARYADDPRWANGLHALTFIRTRPSRLNLIDETLRRYQVSVQHRLNALAWKLAAIMPSVVKAGAKLVMSRSRQIGS